jgi:hypothetical protein
MFYMASDDNIYKVVSLDKRGLFGLAKELGGTTLAALENITIACGCFGCASV